MGYKVKNIYGISTNEETTKLFYYIPSYNLKYSWIDNFIQEKFDEIANRIGQNSILIAPVKGQNEAFIKSFNKSYTNENIGYGFFWETVRHLAKEKKYDENMQRIWGEVTKGESEFFEVDSLIENFEYPLLLVSKTPIKENDNNEALIINLGNFDSEVRLAELFDVLSDFVDDKNNFIALTNFLNFNDPNKFEVLKSLDLKPNFFGIGADFNYILEHIAKKIKKKE